MAKRHIVHYLCSICLACSLCIMTLGTLNMYASAAPKAPDRIQYDFKSNGNISEDSVIPKESVSTIFPDTMISIKEDVTLSVYGQLNNKGTLINYGTLNITQGKKSKTTPGVLENRGRLINFGVIVIEDAQLLNLPDGALDNRGDIKIKGAHYEGTFLRNTEARPTVAETSGTILNSGNMYLTNSSGIGFAQEDNAVFTNTGVVYLGKTGTYSGIISGKVIKEGDPILTPPSPEKPKEQKPMAPPPKATPPRGEVPPPLPHTTTPQQPPASPVTPKIPAPVPPVPPKVGENPKATPKESENSKKEFGNFMEGMPSQKI